MNQNEHFFSVGVIIIDDIFQPDGTVTRGLLGGGSVHAVMGMRVWSDYVSLLAPVHSDFRNQDFPLLDAMFDLTGLKHGALSQLPYGWQIIDQDGNRSEAPQTDYDEMRAALLKSSDLPAHFKHVSGAHLHCPPADVPDWAAALRQRGCAVVLWEPFDNYCTVELREDLLAAARTVDVISPNLEEARTISGLDEPEAIAAYFHAQGVQSLLLRMGAAGCLVKEPCGAVHRVRAYPQEPVVDVTGAGNACSAGFVVGLARTGDYRSAGVYGNISASLALRQYGALYPMEGVRQLAQERLRWYQRAA